MQIESKCKARNVVEFNKKEKRMQIESKCKARNNVDFQRKSEKKKKTRRLSIGVR